MWDTVTRFVASLVTSISVMIGIAPPPLLPPTQIIFNDGIPTTSIESMIANRANDSSVGSNEYSAADMSSTTVIVSSTSTVERPVSTVDIRHLALGDRKISSSAKRGHVFACSNTFNGDGASADVPWVHDSTWNALEKFAVDGRVTWPDAVFYTEVKDDRRTIVSNGLPLDTKTGVFPIGKKDPAYAFDRNPNVIRPQEVSITVPAKPIVARTPSCVGMGVIGVALNGVALFSALDEMGRDAVAHEVHDTCGGHPQKEGVYHYHGQSSCIPGSNENAALVGYALDGFGIYSKYDADGRELTNADLDACHGTTTPVMWDGAVQNIYHYVLTEEYPYTIGCFRGTPVSVSVSRSTSTVQNVPQISQSPNLPAPSRPQESPRPPQDAIAACAGKTDGQVCSILFGPTGVCAQRSGVLACVPR